LRRRYAGAHLGGRAAYPPDPGPRVTEAQRSDARLLRPRGLAGRAGTRGCAALRSGRIDSTLQPVPPLQRPATPGAEGRRAGASAAPYPAGVRRVLAL